MGREVRRRSTQRRRDREGVAGVGGASQTPRRRPVVSAGPLRSLRLCVGHVLSHELSAGGHSPPEPVGAAPPGWSPHPRRGIPLYHSRGFPLPAASGCRGLVAGAVLAGSDRAESSWPRAGRGKRLALMKERSRAGVARTQRSPGLIALPVEPRRRRLRYEVIGLGLFTLGLLLLVNFRAPSGVIGPYLNLALSFLFGVVGSRAIAGTVLLLGLVMVLRWKPLEFGRLAAGFGLLLWIGLGMWQLAMPRELLFGLGFAEQPGGLFGARGVGRGAAPLRTYCGDGGALAGRAVQPRLPLRYPARDHVRRGLRGPGEGRSRDRSRPCCTAPASSRARTGGAPQDAETARRAAYARRDAPASRPGARAHPAHAGGWPY